MIPEGGCPSSHPILTLSLAYLDVMALWDYNIFLREQVLNSVLRNDVLYLRVERRQVLGPYSSGAQ